MKCEFKVKEITKEEALNMIKKYHYSNTLPKINKHFLGFYIEEELVGIVTLGLGTRPLHTIKKIFPSLETKDYYEIGRMCMTEEMPRNSESQMLSACCKWIKVNVPQIKILFTWADGMLGKPGYVYQASSFIYAGYAESEMYMIDGIKIHVRQIKALIAPKDKRITVRPTIEQMKIFNIRHFKGKQYKYLKFLCGRIEKKKLIRECLVSLDKKNPKNDSLSWKEKINGKWEKCDKPNYITDINVKEFKLEKKE